MTATPAQGSSPEEAPPGWRPGARLEWLPRQLFRFLQVVRVLEYWQESDLPALWKPKPNAFIRVEQIPYLGTGKVDLRRVKETAHALSRDPD